MKGRQWLRVLAYVSGLINQELLLQVEYLAAENRILRAHLPNRLRLTRDERSSLGEIGKRVGRKGLEKGASVARPETVPGWFRKLVAQKFDGSKQRLNPGRPAISPELAILIVKLARENSGWRYDRISGAPCQPRTQGLGSECRERAAPPQNRTGSETESDHRVEGLHRLAHGSHRANTLLYCRGPDLAR